MKKRTVDEVYKLLQRSEKFVNDGEWYNITGFNEEEVYAEKDCFDCDSGGDEYMFELEELTENTDFYELKKIED